MARLRADIDKRRKEAQEDIVRRESELSMWKEEVIQLRTELEGRVLKHLRPVMRR